MIEGPVNEFEGEKQGSKVSWPLARIGR